MKYADYDRKVMSEKDLMAYKKHFEKDIAEKQKELEEFIKRANERILWVKDCEENKKYRILGSMFKDGGNKTILLIIRYPDGSDKTERYEFSKITECRDKLDELKKIHSGVDWSQFDIEI